MISAGCRRRCLAGRQITQYMGTNVVEIAKDRDGGIQDCFVPLYYEMETKRLKNHKAENRIYGWDKSDGFVSAENWEIPFD